MDERHRRKRGRTVAASMPRCPTASHSGDGISRPRTLLPRTHGHVSPTSAPPRLSIPSRLVLRVPFLSSVQLVRSHDCSTRAGPIHAIHRIHTTSRVAMATRAIHPSTVHASLRRASRTSAFDSQTSVALGTLERDLGVGSSN